MLLACSFYACKICACRAFVVPIEGQRSPGDGAGQRTLFYAGKTWQAILLVPVAHKLRCSDFSHYFARSVMCVIVARHVAQELATCLCA